MKLEITGEIQEIGEIRYKAIKANPGLVVAAEGLGDFFVPMRSDEIRAFAEQGVIYGKVKMTITFEKVS